ncbi:PucR family transcriptional regulator [Nocardia bovistercoris]|uniref:Helix-turn-helix domain-containing protein n=1 Tax=Nocardia bovistercoris TaxID=2785916 RepID=A0A931IB18_9NOCA|nr:helix-turn-helix domain-containing protein [Nocardia bovistercoris]MBH0776553.1 helix-turn-helix domain-containing protein [Nocardia bovistercoris]
MVSERSAPVRDPRHAADAAAGLLELPSHEPDSEHVCPEFHGPAEFHRPAESDAVRPEPTITVAAPDRPRPAATAATVASDTYHVLALRARHAANSAETGAVGDRPTVLLLDELRNRCGAGIVGDLALGAGTVLVPATGLGDADLDAAVAAAGRATGLAVLAAAVRADLADLRTADKHANELLELADALGRDAGTYRFDDLALEYQLTRPGWARDRLTASIAPLRPELTATLDQYLRHNGDAVATARAMNLPHVSVTAHLGDIARLTGLEPLVPADLWRLHSALIARTGSRRGDERAHAG